MAAACGRVRPPAMGLSGDAWDSGGLATVLARELGRFRSLVLRIGDVLLGEARVA